eukprot:scaffold82285_cov31-Phaeocystis_antarctica.AAC.1
MRGRSSVVMFICSCCSWLLFCASCCAWADGCADIAPSCHEKGEKKRRGASVSFRPGKLLLSAWVAFESLYTKTTAGGDSSCLWRAANAPSAPSDHATGNLRSYRSVSFSTLRVLLSDSSRS